MYAEIDPRVARPNPLASLYSLHNSQIPSHSPLFFPENPLSTESNKHGEGSSVPNPSWRHDAVSSSADYQPLLVSARLMGGDGGGHKDGWVGDYSEEWRVTYELHFGPKKRMCFSIRNF